MRENNYIDQEDGKLDFSRIPKRKKWKLLGLSTASLLLGMTAVLAVTHWVIDPLATFSDFNNFYINKMIHVVMIINIVFPLLLMPLNLLHMLITKTALGDVHSGWKNWFSWKTKLKNLTKQVSLVAPLALIFAWGLQLPFGEVQTVIQDGETYFILPSSWFSITLILGVVLGKSVIVRVLRKIGLAI